MAKRTYRTVSDELVEFADAFADHFEDHGFRLRVEHREIEHPYTATFTLKRHRTTQYIEIDSRIRLDRLGDWARYCMSSNGDTRIALGLPGNATTSPEEEQELRARGIGLYRRMADGVVELVPPKDLALRVELPQLRSLPPSVRAMLGSVYEQFNRSNWREGFEEACQAVEVEARKYLKRDFRRGRIVFITPKGNVRKWTEAYIEGMTMGQLVEAFGSIQSQNYTDSQVGQVLNQLNKDRIGVVHHKTKPTTEQRLRRNVGRNMYRVVAALKALLT